MIKLSTVFWIILILTMVPQLAKIAKDQYENIVHPKTSVGVVTIKGALYKATPVITHLKEFFENKAIKAIILKIDSPGGLAGTAQTIFSEINHYKKVYPQKYVIALVENMAGSGGYYIAAAANHIIASPGAFIGSIGSYIQHPNFREFIEQYKVKYEVIKSGAYKTAGNPLLDLSPEQKALFQSLSDDVYRQFVKDVARQRPQLPADIKVWADGKIFTGEQAYHLKLIDELGSPATVLQVLKDRAKIEGPINFVKPPKKSMVSSFFGADSDDDDQSHIQTLMDKICLNIEQRYTLSPRTINL